MRSENPLNGIIQESDMIDFVPSVAVGVNAKLNNVHGLYDEVRKKDFFNRIKNRKSHTFETANDSWCAVEKFAVKYDLIEIFGGAENACVSMIAYHALDCGLDVVIPKKYTFKDSEFNGTVSDVVSNFVHVPYFFSQTPKIYCLSRAKIANVPAFLLY